MGRICRIVCSIAILLATLTCTEEQPYSTQDSLGKIVGIVKPTGIITQVSLIQGKTLKTTPSDSTGYFKIDSVDAGIYNLEFEADGFGRHMVNEVIVYARRTTTIPDVFLKPFPDQVAALNPADGTTAYPVNSPIQIEFSVPMMHSSVENNFRTEPPVAGYFTWHDNAERSLVKFYPIDQYATNTTYLITLSTRAKTVYADTLSFSLSASFDTEGLKIISTDPRDQESFILPHAGIYIQFNSKIERHNAEPNFSIDPEIDVAFKWFDSKRIILEPYLPLASNTIFAVTIDENIQDVFGSQLASDYAFSFVTEPLTISNNYPTHGATFISRSTPISITFNTLVDQESVESAFQLSPAVEGWNFQWYDLSRFQYSGTTKLMENTSYTVTIDTTCTDAWGNNLPRTFNFTFTTGN